MELKSGYNIEVAGSSEGAEEELKQSVTGVENKLKII